MIGNYCIFDLEPNKDFCFGILKFSWLICKFTPSNDLITLTTKEFFIRQNDKNFKNYNFKFHGISNKKLSLEGEPLLYVLESFAEDLKTFNVDYISGFKIKKMDLPFIFKSATTYNLTSLKEDFFQKKYIIIDVLDVVGKWTTKNMRNIKLDFKSLYPYLFQMDFPKKKYHDSTIDCEHSRNILFNLIISDIELFEDIQPLIDDKIDFKKINELKDLVDEQLLSENDDLKTQTRLLEKRILELELELENKNELIVDKEGEFKKFEIKYLDIRDNKVKLECENKYLKEKLDETEKKLLDTNNKFKKHQEISNRCITQLKEKVKELDLPIEKIIEKYLEDKYKKFEYTDKNCYVCSNKISDICDKCHKSFCDLHIHDIRDGFHTCACDNCYNEVYDNYAKYNLNDEIVLL